MGADMNIKLKLELVAFQIWPYRLDITDLWLENWRKWKKISIHWYKITTW